MNRWAQLQLPLVLSVATENNHLAADELGGSADSVGAGMGSNEVANLLMVLASQGATQAILWNQLNDTPERRAGLYTVDGQAKSIINDIQRLCKEQLGI